jgi:kynurenine formamidase
VVPPGDRLGTLRLLTPERTARAAALVRTGRRIRLDLPVGQPDPPFFGRAPARHEVLRMNRIAFDDKFDDFYPQAGTQWDALGHVGHWDHGFYGGRTADEAATGALGIDAAAEGIVGRGVLLDVAGWAEHSGHPVDPDGPHRITPDDALATAEFEGTRLQAGDIVCVRTGWMSWYRRQDAAHKERVAARSRGEHGGLATVGLAPGDGWAELLWDSGAAALAVDNPAVDTMPFERGTTTLHSDVLPLLGLPLGEFFDLDELARVCAEEGRWDFLFAAVPLLAPGGVGSPGNAVAIL